MKQIIILLVVLAVAAGAWHAWIERSATDKLALFSEGPNISIPIKSRISEYHSKLGIMPSDNNDVGLPSPERLYGSGVKRVAINQGGVVMVDFSERIGDQSMIFTPELNAADGSLDWTCSSESIDEAVLEKLVPICHRQSLSAGKQLMHAIANIESDNIEALLATGVSPDIVVHRNTPLMLAARVGDVASIEQLLEAGAAVDNPADESEGRTPLMVAITHNLPAAASLLLAKGASAKLTDYLGMSAMDYAVISDRSLGEGNFVQMMSAQLRTEFSEPGLGAAQSVMDAEIEERRRQSLYLEYIRAAENCHAQRLISLFREAGELGSSELVEGVPLAENIRLPKCAPQLLTHLQSKPSYNVSAMAYLAARTQQCDVRAVMRGLQENPELDVMRRYNGRNLIDRAVSSGCHTVLRLFVRERNLDGKLDDAVIVTAISLAPQKTLVKLISNLIAAKADVNGRDRQGRAPLTTAIALEQPVIAKFLVDAGASVGYRTSNASFPIIEATKKGYEHLVLQLVAAGADLDARDRRGRTALFAAVNRGHERLVTMLVRAGADTRITDQNGISAVELAESRNLESIKSVLVASTD